MFFEPGLGRGLVFIHVILKKKKSICSKKALRNKKWNKCAIEGKDREKKKNTVKQECLRLKDSD